MRTGVKNGSAPTSSRTAMGRLIYKSFNLPCAFSSGTTYTIGDTRGIRVNAPLILFDGTNYGLGIVQSISTDVSFTLKSNPAGITTGSVTRAYFPGFHTLRLKLGETNPALISALEWEPLDIQRSKHFLRQFPRVLTEVKTVYFEGMTNGQSAYFPVHSDGVPGNFLTSSIDFLRMFSGNISPDLKSITISSGTADLKVTSIRNVGLPIDDAEVF